VDSDYTVEKRHSYRKRNVKYVTEHAVRTLHTQLFRLAVGWVTAKDDHHLLRIVYITINCNVHRVQVVHPFKECVALLKLFLTWCLYSAVNRQAPSDSRQVTNSQ